MYNRMSNTWQLIRADMCLVSYVDTENIDMITCCISFHFQAVAIAS